MTTTSRPTPSRTARDGGPAAVAVDKICGASAEAGADLDEVAGLGHRVARSALMLSLRVERRHPAGRIGATLRAAAGKVELDVGIHVERGCGDCRRRALGDV